MNCLREIFWDHAHKHSLPCRIKLNYWLARVTCSADQSVKPKQALEVINPRRACAARVTVVVLCVCVSVCVCVYDYSRTTGYEAAYERYQQLQC